MTLAVALAFVLREARVERGWTQDDLARRAQTPRGNITHFEAGRNAVSLEMLERLARAYRTPVSELVARAEKIAKGASYGARNAHFGKATP